MNKLFVIETHYDIDSSRDLEIIISREYNHIVRIKSYLGAYKSHKITWVVSLKLEKLNE